VTPSGLTAQSPSGTVPLTDIPQQYVIPPSPGASAPVLAPSSVQAPAQNLPPALSSGTPVGTTMSFIKPAAAVVDPDPNFKGGKLPKVQPPIDAVPRTPREQQAPNNGDDAATQFQVRVNMPGPETLYRLESETQLQERLRQEFRQLNEPSADVDFPQQKLVLTKSAYQPRNLPQQAIYAEPAYLVYHRLYFEQKNFDRYGWELGFLQPIVSAAMFYKDLAFLPYHMGEDIRRRYDVSVNNCLPGDPVPLTFIPPHISLSGGFLQTLATVGLVAAFP